MSNAKHGRVWISAVLMFLSLPAHAQSGSDHRCSESPGFYERENYIVHEVRIEAPLDWLLGSVSQKLRNILSDASMPIRKGNVFRKADSDAGFIKLTDNFPELTVSPIDRVAVRLAAPGLENCDKKARTLDVVYRVYTFGFSYYLSRAFESGGKEEVRRSVVETPATERFADYFPQPFIGYNRSRDFYGGTRLAIKLPGGLLDKISLGASGSSSSVEAGAAAEGSRSYNKSSIRQLEYQFRYSYSDIPAKSLKLKESTVLGQVFAATRAFGPQELILRFGGSFEGGNKHTGDQRSTSAADLANSGYGSLKAFVGGTLRSGMQAFKGS